ncbi:S49 family peptidase [bacterium]|nr:S49 family peptidase [bacterium]
MTPRPAIAIAAALGLAVLAAASPPAHADPARTDLLPASPGVTAGALGGLANPAAWATARGELAFSWDDETDLDAWTLAFASPLGFAMETTPDSWRYQLGFAQGNGRTFTGLGWRWSTGEDGTIGTDSGLIGGMLWRPRPYLSLGHAGFASVESSSWSVLFDLGIRPFGTPAVTLFGDWSREHDHGDDDRRWSAGAEWRPYAGIHLGARVRETPGTDDLETLVNVGVTFDELGYHTLARVDADGEHAGTRHGIRANPPHRGLPVARWTGSRHPDRLVPVNLSRKRVGYRKDLWFDDDRVAWLDLSRRLRSLREDPTVAGVAVDLSASHIRPSILWELRQELQAFRDAGKTVAVQIERPRMSHYYLASVADHVQMDPFGWVDLTGIAARRTYWKGLLDRAGVGFEEHRYFTHKSAMERYSRTDMSDVDREQIGRFVDVIWEEFADGIAEGRGMSRGDVARIGDDEAILRAEGAKDAGLVDAVGRWEDLEDWARDRGLRLAAPLPPRATPEERWGAPRRLVVVYASGASEMDAGFRGRATGEELRRLAKRRDVAAVVLRSDSPGGDPMAADHIAEGMAAVRDSGKPMIVTQGDVAASAGYSICLEADHIYTTPLTLTGSIGVISGWAWDEGLGRKTGFSADGVQRGEHADLFSGIRFPIVNAVLPQRNLTEKEKQIVQTRIVASYDDFVRHVARARELPEEHVREIAEGRIWVGRDALALDLVDGEGSLADAIADARARAGIPDDEEIVVEEFPARQRFRLPSFLPSLPSLSIGTRRAASAADAPAAEALPDADPFLLLRTLLEHAGEPCHLVPTGQLPDEWLPAD